MGAHSRTYDAPEIKSTHCYIHCLFLFSLYVVLFLAGIMLFYIVIAVYLYGDLAIYAAAVPKSLTRVTWLVLFLFVSSI